MRAYTSERGDLTVLRLPPGTDLLPGLNRAAADLGLEAAWVNVIGAFRNLVYGHYDEEAREYRTLEHRGFLEIASAMGNVSLKGGKPFTHLHVVVGDADGRAFAGHLFEGSEVFVAEVAFHRLTGPAPVREPDEATGLDMWPVE
jgi:uncharacterized protein